jgi:acyl homoserine lactone synthase
MYAIALQTPQFGRHLDLLAAMYRLRRRVFKDRLDWSVSVSGELELDVYDALGPTYLILMSDAGEVVGSVRLLPTTGPTMLADTFPSLLGGVAAPRNERVLESSRFCVDTRPAAEQAGNGLGRATFILFAAMIEAARIAGADSIVTVTDVRMERILRLSGERAGRSDGSRRRSRSARPWLLPDSWTPPSKPFTGCTNRPRLTGLCSCPRILPKRRPDREHLLSSI